MNLFLLLTLSLVAAPAAAPLASATSVEPVNAIVGDAGFVAAEHRDPTPEDAEVARIRAHLAYVVASLRQTHAPLSPALLAEREGLLDVLAAYAARGEFPVNHVYPGRRPVFIDPDGTLCAVGALVAHASGRAAAEAIAARHRYDYVLDMHDSSIDAWAAEHGFTLRELAMIQPSYHWREPGFPGPTPLPEPPPRKLYPEGASPLSVPNVLAFQLLSGVGFWQDPSDASAWTKVEAASQMFLVRVDADRRVTGIATSIRSRTMGRFTWTAFYPTGEIMAKGAVTNGQPTNTWTFYNVDGSVLRKAQWSGDSWR